MKLVSVSIKNFRCYKDEFTVSIGDLTTLIGRNDIGKSTVLEALDAFFNNTLEQADLNVQCNENENVEITCEFLGFPEKITIDSSSETTFQDEYLLTSRNTLKISKVCTIYDFAFAGNVLSEFRIIAQHPTVCNLLELNSKELKNEINSKNLSTDSRRDKPKMRRVIWDSLDDLHLEEIIVPMSDDMRRRIVTILEQHLPIFTLFKSDRGNSDRDEEVQNPMQIAIREALAEVRLEINRIQNKVKRKALEIVENTYIELNIIAPNIAKELTPTVILPEITDWIRSFPVGLKTESNIPLNKRGSGVRRMVLLAFLKAEATRKLNSASKRSIIYAVEEPETSQHPRNQKILIESLNTLANQKGCQVILTTHSPGLASELPTKSIRYIHRDDKMGKPCVAENEDVFGEVADVLGVIPDSRVKVLFYVEGPTDIIAWKSFSKALNKKDQTLPNLETDKQVAFVIAGGDTLTDWVHHHHLGGLKLPEIHVYDGDVAKYEKSIRAVNERKDGSWGIQLKKRAIENYLHPNAVEKKWKGVKIIIEDNNDVPEMFRAEYDVKYPPKKNGKGIKHSTAKQKLRETFSHMNAEHIKARDPDDEIIGILRKIAELCQ